LIIREDSDRRTNPISVVEHESFKKTSRKTREWNRRNFHPGIYSVLKNLYRQILLICIYTTSRVQRTNQGDISSQDSTVIIQSVSDHVPGNTPDERRKWQLVGSQAFCIHLCYIQDYMHSLMSQDMNHHINTRTDPEH
jgi:hypothetical protein